MSNPQILLKDYLKMTGQSKQELFAGAETVGINWILEMLPKCLEQKTKIVWFPKKGEAGKAGLMDYKIEPISS